ncbi:hypothetical protein SDC9_196618 [bioreactor metagenome]|uniref:Uncharacterized protein n=1 Tax=bioreactor metagenome TaxID=1076179 RepID=A0A645ICI9_9ZZZZ
MHTLFLELFFYCDVPLFVFFGKRFLKPEKFIPQLVQLFVLIVSVGLKLVVKLFDLSFVFLPDVVEITFEQHLLTGDGLLLL